MASDGKEIKQYLCPGCFAREIDITLSRDEDDGQYYCRRCCWAGDADEIEKFYAAFTKMKYPMMAEPYE